MDSTVKSRLNHYELLGLSPAATLDEIDQAFARELRLPRAFGSLAEFTVAYETLRDPIKRKAYDASIERKPEPRPALSLAGRLEAAALGAVPTKPLVHAKPSSPPPPAARSLPRPESRPAPRTAPSATALLHQPITPGVPRPDPMPQAKGDLARAEALPPRQPEPQTANEDLVRPPARTEVGHEQHEFRWKLPVLAAGALILAIGGGAWMGVESGNDASKDQLKPAVTLDVPPARAAAPVAASGDEAPSIANAPSEPPARAAASAPKEPARPPLQIDLPDEQPTEVAALEQQQREIEQAGAPAPAPAVATTSAKMPLPNSVIASTIGRIGYPCGQVASATPAEGAAPGVFKVTCTSGHSYRATPVNGRYRFRRLGGR